MRRLSLVFGVVVCLVVSGCAVKGIQPIQQDIDKSKVYNAPFDKVWEAIISVIAESNLNITTLEKSSGIIAVNTSYNPNWAEEGTMGSVMGVPDKVIERSATFNIFAKQLGLNKTSVQVNSSFKMYIRSGNGSQAFPFTRQWDQAYSNGTLENILLSGIEKRIQ